MVLAKPLLHVCVVGHTSTRRCICACGYSYSCVCHLAKICHISQTFGICLLIFLVTVQYHRSALRLCIVHTVNTAKSVLQTVRDTCFEKCVTKPSTSLSSSEQQCLARCTDRYGEVSSPCNFAPVCNVQQGANAVAAAANEVPSEVVVNQTLPALWTTLQATQIVTKAVLESSGYD